MRFNGKWRQSCEHEAMRPRDSTTLSHTLHPTLRPRQGRILHTPELNSPLQHSAHTTQPTTHTDTSVRVLPFPLPARTYVLCVRRDARVSRRNLVQQVDVGDRVLDVSGEVGDLTPARGARQVEVDPADQDLLRSEAHEVLEGFALEKQRGEVRVHVQVDVAQQSDLQQRAWCASVTSAWKIAGTTSRRNDSRNTDTPVILFHQRCVCVCVCVCCVFWAAPTHSLMTWPHVCVRSHICARHSP